MRPFEGYFKKLLTNVLSMKFRQNINPFDLQCIVIFDFSLRLTNIQFQIANDIVIQR